MLGPLSHSRLGSRTPPHCYYFWIPSSLGSRTGSVWRFTLHLDSGAFPSGHDQPTVDVKSTNSAAYRWSYRHQSINQSGRQASQPNQNAALCTQSQISSSFGRLLAWAKGGVTRRLCRVIGDRARQLLQCPHLHERGQNQGPFIIHPVPQSSC